MTNNFDFLCVVYNNYEDTLEYCNSLCSMDLIDCNIRCFVLDNSTNDDIISQVKQLPDKYDFVTVLRSGSNLGYFGAFNYFFETSYFDTNRIVVICNNDLVFDKYFCTRYIENTGKYPSDAMVICPDVVTSDGRHQNPHLLKRLGFFSRLKLDLYFSNYYLGTLLKIIKFLLTPIISGKGYVKESSGYIYLGIGACYILNKKFFESFDRLIYPHFIYGEEAYLSSQVHSVHGRLYYDSTLIVTHKDSATFKKLPSKLVYEYEREGYWSYRKLY